MGLLIAGKPSGIDFISTYCSALVSSYWKDFTVKYMYMEPQDIFLFMFFNRHMRKSACLNAWLNGYIKFIENLRTTHCTHLNEIDNEEVKTYFLISLNCCRF